MSAEQIRTATSKLIEHLRSLHGADSEQGIRAAGNIEKTLALFATDPDTACAQLSYDVGGKGLLDWIWSEEHRIEIKAFSDELFALLCKFRAASDA